MESEDDENDVFEENFKSVIEDDKVIEEGDPVKPGDTLVVSEPFVYAIQPQYKTKVCEYCLKYKDVWNGIKLCSKCEVIGYCSDLCKEADEERHRLECSLVRHSGRKQYPHRAWFVARACLRVQKEGYDIPDRINNKKSRCFGDLMDHYDDVTNDMKKLENDFWFKEVSEILGSLMPEREEYISIYGRLLVNSFALRADNNGEEENVGTALYRANSIFDHSCQPNATTVFSGKKLYIKSIVSSPSLDLSQFYIAYLDHSIPRDARRNRLRNTWYFECGCSGCQDLDTELCKHSAICSDTCNGCVNVDVSTWLWSPCNTCGAELSKTNKFRYQEIYEMVRDVVDENGGDYTYTDVNEFLVKQMSPVFHTLDIELLQASNGAANGYYISKDWVKALPFFEKSLPGIRKYYTPLCGYLSSALERYADCLHHNGQIKKAQLIVQEANDIMKIIPGKDNYYYKQYFLPKLQKIL